MDRKIAKVTDSRAIFNFDVVIKELEKDIGEKKDISIIKSKYLGKRGEIAKLTANLKNLPANKKSELGKKINLLRKEIVNIISQITPLPDNKPQSLDFDPTLPGQQIEIGSLHLVTKTIQEIEDIFSRLGFYRRRYPEVETDYFAFEALNMPIEHPARDEWETFFVKSPRSAGALVLTPHTSNGQVREMLKTKPPIRMLNIAKCYRRQEDATHTQMFFQFEGLLIDRDVSIKNLIGTLDFFVKNYFGNNRKTRLRPYDFRFTEPSFEVDINCPHCLGKGCKTCKGGGHELGGAGMVHPNVLKSGKIDTKKYNGFAFGWGVERIAMMKYKIPDLRMIYGNDLRFLKQF